ncbi:MAG: hypothetical protein JW918_16085 [Anaerolineae bacterium]|nr:hypothetical protein [Anaerolineae bacterium]
MKHSQKKLVAILFAVLLAAAALVIAIGYAGDLTGTVGKDSPLPTPEESPTDTPESPPPDPTDTPESPPPTDTPEPPTATYTITPSETTAHRIRIEVRWYDADNNVLGGPPAGLPADFAITAASDMGSATCTYPAGSTSLSCTYSNDVSAPDDSGLWISDGDSYTVSQTDLPAGWSSFGGIGTFPDSGFTTHIVHNRAPAAPAAPTDTPPPAEPLEATSTPTPKPKPPTAVPPTDTPVPSTATSTPEPPTDTPMPPTATSTPEPPTDAAEPPTSTPTDTAEPTSMPQDETSTPAAAAQAGGEPTLTPTSTPETATGSEQTGSTTHLGTAIGIGAGLGIIILVLFLLRRRNAK